MDDPVYSEGAQAFPVMALALEHDLAQTTSGRCCTCLSGRLLVRQSVIDLLPEPRGSLMTSPCGQLENWTPSPHGWEC